MATTSPMASRLGHLRFFTATSPPFSPVIWATSPPLGNTSEAGGGGGACRPDSTVASPPVSPSTTSGFAAEAAIEVAETGVRGIPDAVGRVP